jgi:hypothetical protein
MRMSVRAVYFGGGMKYQVATAAAEAQTKPMLSAKSQRRRSALSKLRAFGAEDSEAGAAPAFAGNKLRFEAPTFRRDRLSDGSNGVGVGGTSLAMGLLHSLRAQCCVVVISRNRIVDSLFAIKR